MYLPAPIVMYDGALADLTMLAPSQIDFAHMASSLSKIARWAGRHPGAGFSVAQHSIVGADEILRETGDQVMAGYFLLHDGHEYLIGDQTRPTVRIIDHHLRTEFRRRHPLLGLDIDGLLSAATTAAKAELDRVIHAAARLPPIEAMPLYARTVAEMDERMCLAEARALYGDRASIPLVEACLPPLRVGPDVFRKPWPALKAEEQFIARLERYLGIVVRPS